MNSNNNSVVAVVAVVEIIVIILLLEDCRVLSARAALHSLKENAIECYTSKPCSIDMSPNLWSRSAVRDALCKFSCLGS